MVQQVFWKTLLLRGHGYPQDDTTPNFFPNSNSPMLGLSNEVSFVSELYQKDGKNSKNENLLYQDTCPQVYEPRGLRCDSILNICKAFLKSANLLHKWGNGLFPISSTVSENLAKNFESVNRKAGCLDKLRYIDCSRMKEK